MSPTPGTKPKPGLSSAVELMRLVHGADARLDAEYPLVFRDGFPGRVVALSDERGPRSACAILTRDFVMPGARLRVGLIGSVSTDPECQKRGFGTRLLAEAEAALAQEGCVLSMLWADDPGFYYRRGYRPAGHECDHALASSARQALPASAGVRPATQQDGAALHALYAAHETRVERTARETAALLECPAMQTLVLERRGQPVAYACLGRGRDLMGVVHEWAGATDDVLALVRAHLERLFPAASAEGTLYVLVPPGATDMRARLTAIGSPCIDGVLGLAKVLDRAALGRLLKAGIRPEGSVRIEEDAGQVRVHLVGQSGSVELTDDDLLHVLLPARGLREEIDELAASFGIELAGLPLAPFCWGLDSI